MRGILRSQHKTGYTGPLTWELYTYDEAPDEACERTFKYLRTLLLERKLTQRKTAAKTFCCVVFWRNSCVHPGKGPFALICRAIKIR